MRHRARQRSSTQTSTWKRVPLWAYLAAFAAVVALAIALPVYLTQRDSAEVVSSSTPAASSDSNSRVGIASGFTLEDPYEQSYTLTFGDGKNHLLVFYMGNF